MTKEEDREDWPYEKCMETPVDRENDKVEYLLKNMKKTLASLESESPFTEKEIKQIKENLVKDLRIGKICIHPKNLP